MKKGKRNTSGAIYLYFRILKLTRSLFTWKKNCYLHWGEVICLFSSSFALRARQNYTSKYETLINKTKLTWSNVTLVHQGLSYKTSNCCLLLRGQFYYRFQEEIFKRTENEGINFQGDRKENKTEINYPHIWKDKTSETHECNCIV